MNALRHYNRARRQGIAAGTWLFNIPAEPVRAYVDSLLAAGMTRGQIARVAGVDISTVRRLRAHETVCGRTAASLLAVTARTAPPRVGLISSTGTCRRVRALAALGWSFPQQAKRLGVSPQRVRELSLLGDNSWVTPETADGVSDLFEQLSATPGDSTKARRHAARNGWLPPLAWDDLDDPRESPDRFGPCGQEFVDEVAVERSLDGDDIDLTDRELIAALQMGTARGVSLSKLAHQFRLNCFSARKMLGGDLPPRREQQARVDAAFKELGATHADQIIGTLAGAHRQTVTVTRRRLAQRQHQLAS
jgi:hypothetical protein